MQTAIETIRIGLIDDDELFRTDLAGMLHERRDFDVVFQDSDARRVFELVHKHKPHVLLLDIAMPKVDGMRAARELLGATDSGDLRIILLTFIHDSDMIQEALEIGVHGYITKDQAEDLIAEAIRSAIRASKVVLAAGIKTGTMRILNIRIRQELTRRETEIAELLSRGLTPREISETLEMNIATVQRHRSNIRIKLNFDRYKKEFTLQTFLHHYLHNQTRKDL